MALEVVKQKECNNQIERFLTPRGTGSWEGSRRKAAGESRPFGRYFVRWSKVTGNGEPFPKPLLHSVVVAPVAELRQGHHQRERGEQVRLMYGYC